MVLSITLFKILNGVVRAHTCKSITIQYPNSTKSNSAGATSITVIVFENSVKSWHGM